jgi:type I restriction-modification system DNA methylase subunit
MTLYQKKVLDKYIKALDKKAIQEKYETFKTHFHNPIIQENIKKSKEEEYQEGFLTDLFVNILGYTKNPLEGYNLTTELKNVKDTKKVDGAIIIEDIVVAVIELKGVSIKDKDFKETEQQAFNYKNNQVGCNYVIISNFQKIRLYIDNAVTHQEWDLFSLTEEQFQELYISLAFENIKSDLPKKIKDKSLNEQDTITKELYKDYSTFKRDLYQDLVANNPEINQLTLFKKAQKLLDRFLFLFFAEDRGLLQPQSVRTIVKRWKTLKDLDAYKPLIESYKQYFGYLNDGYQSKDLVVYAYNGGLFAPDDIIDNLIISDDVLEKHTIKISDYDFESEVDVNILGHIFENSLNELEEVEAEIRGDIVEKTKTKRKKDGVFYTPKYITKYIVDNTIGKLCIEKKIELNINEEDYSTEKNIQSKTKKSLVEKLDTYRNWLLQLTICDPACGSGAFLNQALDFLIEEHAYIDELQAKLFGDALVLSDIEGSILENNLYGVDINEESIEIAKLSLWLRTAEPNRKLTSLSNNLKSGNSLIDDAEVAGNKAFKWKKEFPHVFEKGGFDIIIGNPPYGVSFDESTKKYLNDFDSLVPDYEIYIYFISLYRSILKRDGYLSYIFPNTFLSTLFGKKYRAKIFEEVSVDEIVDLSTDNTFLDASVRTIIFTFKNSVSNYDYKTKFTKVLNKQFYLHESIDKNIVFENIENIFNLFTQSALDKGILNKIISNESLNDFFEISQGLIPYDKYRGHDENTIKNRIWHSNIKKDETYKRELKGADVNSYSINWNGNLWISYGDWLAAPRQSKFFINERILVREITSDKLYCSFTSEEFYNTPSLINIINEKGVDILTKVPE